MFCKNCGSQIPDGINFCPNCGGKVGQTTQNNFTANNSHSSAQPQYQQAQQQTYQQPQFQTQYQPQYDQPVQPVPKKKTGKLPLIIVSVVLVIAIAVGAVFAVPKLSGGSSSSNNTFYSASKEVSKKSANHDVLMVFSAAYNTVFDSDSFTFRATADGESINGKLQLGQDLASTNFCFSFDDADKRFVMRNGALLISAYGDGCRIDVNYVMENLNEICDVCIQSMREASQSESDTYVTDKIEGNLPDLLESFYGIVSNNRINLNKLDIFESTYISIFNHSNNQNISAPTVQEALNIIARFITVADSNSFVVSSEKEGKTTRYTISLNADAIITSFRNFVDTDEEIANYFSAYEHEIKDEIVAEFKYYVEEIAKAGTSIVASVEKERLTGVELQIAEYNYYNSLTFTDINSTVVDDSDWNFVNSSVEEEYITVNSMDSFFELLNDLI